MDKSQKILKGLYILLIIAGAALICISVFGKVKSSPVLIMGMLLICAGNIINLVNLANQKKKK